MNPNREPSPTGSDQDPKPSPFDRYSRQTRFHEIGEAGQQRLSKSKVFLVGCGALGSFIANILARSGVGKLVIADRDFLEISNLQRQVLYDEKDVEEGLPKAIAAANKLRNINSAIEIEPIVKDIDYTNIESYCRDADLILDGTDNFEIRFLINDVSIKLGIPWIYGGCLGASGQSMSIIPGKTACLHCLMTDGPPPPGTTATCDTAGIIAPIIGAIASIECADALKILTGGAESMPNQLTIVDLWDKHLRQMDLSTLSEDNDCPVCKRREFKWLGGHAGSHSAILCGRNSVQLSYSVDGRLDLPTLARKLEAAGKVTLNDFLLRLDVSDYRLTIFPDGRTIVSGTEDVAKAKSLYSQYVGS